MGVSQKSPNLVPLHFQFALSGLIYSKNRCFISRKSIVTSLLKGKDCITNYNTMNNADSTLPRYCYIGASKYARIDRHFEQRRNDVFADKDPQYNSWPINYHKLYICSHHFIIALKWPFRSYSNLNQVIFRSGYGIVFNDRRLYGHLREAIFCWSRNLHNHFNCIWEIRQWSSEHERPLTASIAVDVNLIRFQLLSQCIHSVILVIPDIFLTLPHIPLRL